MIKYLYTSCIESPKVVIPVYDYYGELLKYVSQTKHIKQLTFKKPKRVNAFSKRVSLNISLKHFKKIMKK